MEVIENLNKIFYRAKEGDTLEKIAQIFGVSKDYILENNKIVGSIEEGDVIYLPTNKIKIHIVQPLENFNNIAKIYGITEKEIKEFNNVNTLFIGQKILIPN